MSKMAPQRGCFITLEGLEGVGKTTNLAFVSDWLTQQGIPFVVTREPGGTPLAEDIRELLLTPREEPVDHWCELLLVFAARAQHLNTLIEPALAAGTWVLCDRFTDATYAYQGAGRGIPLEHIAQLERLVQKNLQPDRVLLLDASAAVGLARAKQRGDLDRFESERRAFFDRARAVYLERAMAAPNRYTVVDASLPLPEVQAEIASSLSQLLITGPS